MYKIRNCQQGNIEVLLNLLQRFMKMLALRFTIQGRVQGVGFRYFVLHHARQLGVKGFVKNLPDGSVLVEAVGNEESVYSLMDLCRQGPPRAKITGFLVNDALYTDYEDFIIK
jgi:acylphosphatase